MFETINYQVLDGVATITINRPEVSNAFSLITYNEVREAVEKAGESSDVRVVVITGEGKHFSAGGDIKRFKMLIETEAYLAPEGVLATGAMAKSVKLCPKPVVAKVNGAASGAGCALALACDFRVMEPNSKLIMSFINMGFSGDTAGLYFLNRMIGTAKATEAMTFAKPIKAEEALSLGLATKVSKEGELDTATEELVNTLKNRPTQAIARQKQLNFDFFFNDLDEFVEKEAQYMVETGRTADHKEAVYAFLEKRKPDFTGQ